MSTSLAHASPVTHEERLEFSQQLKHQMLVELMPKEEGQVLPKDEKERELMLKIITASDKTTLGQLKLKSSDLQSQSDQILAGALANLAAKLPHQMFKVEGHQRTLPAIPSDVLEMDVSVVPGELDTQQESLNYKQFAGQFKKSTEIMPSEDQGQNDPPSDPWR